MKAKVTVLVRTRQRLLVYDFYHTLGGENVKFALF